MNNKNTEFSGTKVLVLDGGSRQILPILRGLHDIGCHITSFNGAKTNNGYLSKYPDEKILCRSVNDGTEALEDAILREVKTGKYDVLMPLSDGSTDVVTQNFEELRQYVKIPVPTREVFLRAYNKQITMQICMDNDIPCPITMPDGQDVYEFCERIGYPVIAKPRMACGSMGLKIICSALDLRRLIDNGTIELNRYVVQEFIPQTGKQFNVHMFVDDSSNIKMGLVTEKCRWYPIDGGASCMCRTILKPDVLDSCVRLVKQVQWRGYCEIDLIEDPRDNIFKVMEINGRPSANVKICCLVGMNTARQMIELAFGKRVINYSQYTEDIRMRCMHTDLLWFLQSPDRFTRKPSWFSRRNTHDQIFSLSDPLPFLGFTIESVKNYHTAMKKRKRN